MSGGSVALTNRQETIRCQAEGFWWSDQAYFPQEGELVHERCYVQAKQTKKLVLRLECKECKTKAQRPLKRCKTLEIGEKKNKDAQAY